VRRLTAVAVAVLVFVPGAFLVATSTAASAAATITIGKPALVDRVLVNLPVTVTCDVGNPATTFFPPTASIEQAVGKKIASGEGFASGPSPFTVNCDGVTPTSFVIQVLAATSGPPFQRGKAIVEANFSINGPNGGESASTGPVSVKL
jgi:hypothetical protein